MDTWDRHLHFSLEKQSGNELEEYQSYRVKFENLSLNSQVDLLFHTGCLHQLQRGHQSHSDGETLIHRWDSKNGISSVLGREVLIHIIFFSIVHILLIIKIFLFCLSHLSYIYYWKLDLCIIFSLAQLTEITWTVQITLQKHNNTEILMAYYNKWFFFLAHRTYPM